MRESPPASHHLHHKGTTAQEGEVELYDIISSFVKVQYVRTDVSGVLPRLVEVLFDHAQELLSLGKRETGV